MNAPIAEKPFVFRDGRVYEVLEARICKSGKECLCEFGVLETNSQQYREFRAFFYNSFFSDEMFSADDKEGLLQHMRRRIADYLLSNRQHVAFSRALAPVTWREK